MALNAYTGSDAGQLTVNGELHKLAQDVFTDDWLHMAAVGPFKREARFQKLLRFA